MGAVARMTPLETAGRAGLRVRGQPPAHDHQRTGEGQSRHPDRVASGRHIAVRGLVDRGLLALAAQAAQHNELFAQCAEAR